MRAWKEHGVRRAARLAAELVAAHVEPPAADVITYIPPDPIRQLHRAVHPGESLARGLAERWGVQAEPLLVRTRPATRQAGLPLAHRAGNVRGLFAAAGDTAHGRVVLVDDVYTTGATASAAATALRSAGAQCVYVVTFARALR